jgi:MerR family redox-sensitive transcriptional activator SoxR
VLTIGQLSTATGVPTSTLRFWERKGLLPADARQAGQRRYDEDALTKVALLRLCQDAGLTLSEIGQIVHERVALSPSWRGFVRTKMDSLEENIAHLQHAHAMLAHALECPHEDISQCPKFRQALNHRRGNPPGVDSELATCPDPLRDLSFGDEGQERDGAREQHEQGANH